MREKRRRFRYAGRAGWVGRRLVVGIEIAKRRMRLRRARGERSEQIAQRPALRLVAMSTSVVDVDELAARVDVLDRVLERRLPGGEQDGR